MRDVQFRLRDHFVAALVGRFDVTDAPAQAAELTAEEYLRRDLALAREITRDFIANSDELHVAPDPKGIDVYRQKADSCLTALRR
jgi:hypothetical protein